MKKQKYLVLISFSLTSFHFVPNKVSKEFMLNGTMTPFVLPSKSMLREN